ncbi:hypothetical protein KQI41_04125 [Tissierella pigra]|uniref:Uncharacterized protein n=1 Tax=Tissierella pigra TaxID=2607614 RepID=A0A6N7XSW9_9FIRM|nr:hypothetical protein [Tissierella pigra]MBU5425592.1 hypothetical protein [Tissierella pigra]MSU00857.1 hypothetical protein [Tissierella pigra]
MVYVLIVFTIVGLMDLGDLIKANKNKELKVTIFLMIVAFILSTLYVLDYRLPSIMLALDKFVRDVLGLGYE